MVLETNNNVYVKIRESIINCLPGTSHTLLELTCRDLARYSGELSDKKGLYIFVDKYKGIIYYVGRSSDLLKRLKMHCNASIGASEGVVRFLMYLLGEICSNNSVFSHTNVVKREKIIKRILREFIGKLNIYVVTCSDKIDLGKVEDCLRKYLKPILNPL